MCCKSRVVKLALATISLLIAIFDFGSNWYAFGNFVAFKTTEQDNKLTIALGVLCAVASVLFALEIRHAVMTFKTYDQDSGFDPETMSYAERRLEMWKEAVTFLQLVLEDFPITVVMYMVFTRGGCQLFARTFEETGLDNLVLCAAFLSAIWKVFTAYCYCCCGGYKGVPNCGLKCCCCCQRTFRALIAFVLLGYALYLFVTFNGFGKASRPDCLDETMETPTPATIFGYDNQSP